MDKYLIITNKDKDEKLCLSNRIKQYLADKRVESIIATEDGEYYSGDVIREDVLEGVKAVIVLGGDGTMLRASHSLGKNNLPLLGINLGTVGFLTEVEETNVFASLDKLICGDYKLEKRMMIEGTVKGKTYQALNDIVITRAGFSRIIGLNIYVNDQLLDTYEADGVIVATPTGSTGYNMSAGGPIVSPGARAMVVTPISPHSFTTKSVVFSCFDKIRIDIVKKRKTQNTEAIVSFDGGNSTELSAGDTVLAELSAMETTFIKIHDTNFYSVLRDKIGG